MSRDKKSHKGGLYKNKRRRKGPEFHDPNLMGFLDLPQGKVSLAGFIQDDDKRVIKLMLKAWCKKSNKFSYGQITLINQETDTPAPNLMGECIFASAKYSLAGWLNSDDKNGNYIKITARFMSYVENRDLSNFY